MAQIGAMVRTRVFSMAVALGRVPRMQMERNTRVEA
jgi:hypothetical protein